MNTSELALRVASFLLDTVTQLRSKVSQHYTLSLNIQRARRSILEHRRIFSITNAYSP